MNLKMKYGSMDDELCIYYAIVICNIHIQIEVIGTRSYKYTHTNETNILLVKKKKKKWNKKIKQIQLKIIVVLFASLTLQYLVNCFYIHSIMSRL